jgi:DNA-directed RNA polymerase subunit K/omega
MPSKSTNKISLNTDKKKLQGGISVKDDGDKIDKEDWDSNPEEDVDEEDVEEKEEEEEEEEEEKEEKEKEDEVEGEEEVEGVDDGEDDCLYNITKKKKTIDIELDLGEDVFEDDNTNKEIKYVKPEERVTKPMLFEFERVRILGERATQISMGAKPMIKNVDKLDPKTIAKMELEKKVIPLIVLRELPNGLIEKWKISELKQ